MKVIPPIAFKSSPLIHKSALGAEFSVDWVYEKETFSEYFSNGWNRALAFPAYRGDLVGGILFSSRTSRSFSEEIQNEFFVVASGSGNGLSIPLISCVQGV